MLSNNKVQQSKPSRSCVFVLQCLRFRVLKLCAICFIKLSSSFLNNGRLCPTRLAAMPRRPVTHAASDLDALAAQSASDYEEALRGKTREESTCVTCRCAAFELARIHCAFVMHRHCQVRRGPPSRWKSGRKNGRARFGKPRLHMDHPTWETGGVPRIPSALRQCVGTRGASASDRLLH